MILGNVRVEIGMIVSVENRVYNGGIVVMIDEHRKGLRFKDRLDCLFFDRRVYLEIAE